MSNSDTVTSLYLQVLGRLPDPGGLAADTAALNAGESAAQLEASLAASPEAQADLANAYQTILNRPIDPSGQASATAALASGTSLTQIKLNLATSPEAQSDLSALYQTELNRSPDISGELFFENALANGLPFASLPEIFATSSEAQGDLANLYETILGRAPDAGGLASATQFLANGGALTTIKVNLIDSPEIINDVTAAYEAALGHAPTTDEIAGYQSELATQSFKHLQAELSELSGSPPTPLADGLASIDPQTVITGGVTNLVYGLGNNDALIATQPKTVELGDEYYLNPLTNDQFILAAEIIGFNVATDVLQIQSLQNSSFSSLSLTGHHSVAQ